MRLDESNLRPEPIEQSSRARHEKVPGAFSCRHRSCAEPPNSFFVIYSSQAVWHAGNNERGTVRMRNKLLLSAAALLAGVALASAQSMQGAGEQRGGAAQGQQSQSSPSSETQRGHEKQGQSQQGPQGQKQG